MKSPPVSIQSVHPPTPNPPPSFYSERRQFTIGTRDCWNFIEFFKKGRLIMLVTHSMEEAEYKLPFHSSILFGARLIRLLADSVIVMQKGEIVAAGTPL